MLTVGVFAWLEKPPKGNIAMPLVPLTYGLPNIYGLFTRKLPLQAIYNIGVSAKLAESKDAYVLSKVREGVCLLGCQPTIIPANTQVRGS
jgi:hypothetical protein